MRILILSWRDPKHPNAGGAEVSTLEHAKAWTKAGHEVWWFASNFSRAKRVQKIDGVRIIRSGRQFFDVQIRAFFWFFFGRHPKFDLVVDQFHGIPFFTPLYIRAKKLAYIHEVAKEVWRLNPWPKPLNLIPAFLGPILEPLIFKLLYKKVPFMTVSRSTKKDLTAWGIPLGNITIIHNGVNLNLPKLLPKKEKKKTAIFLGALTKDKGIEDAIKALGLINQTDPNWQFWVVGKGSPAYIRGLKKLAEDFKVLSKIRFWGYVSEKKKFELLARAHILINPSIREGWGLVNIEANASGTPVVAYDVPGCRDSVKNGKTGLLSKPGEYRSLADNSLKLVNNEDFYKEVRKNALSWSKKFTWQKAGRKSLKLIENL